MKNPVLKMENISKWFERVHALKGVNFEANSGEIIAIVGDNGAGKSTLMHILVGFIKPNDGCISIEGKKVEINSPAGARELGIEMVYQGTATISEMSVMQNIFLDREITKQFGPTRILNKRKMREDAKALMRDLGLNVYSPDQLAAFCSGGERQGISIARAMYFNAKIVILDEPTTSLSVKGTKRVINFIKDLKKKNSAVIVIIHDVDIAYNIADRFVVMSLGQKKLDISKEKITVEELREVLTSG